MRVPEMLKAGYSNEQSQSDTGEKGGVKSKISSDRLKENLWVILVSFVLDHSFRQRHKTDDFSMQPILSDFSNSSPLPKLFRKIKQKVAQIFWEGEHGMNNTFI